MKRFLIFALALVCAALSAQMFGQHIGIQIPPMGGVTSLFSQALLNLGPQSKALNPVAHWYSPARNLLTSSEDLTGSGWVYQYGSADDATHFTATGQYGNAFQNVATKEFEHYTYFVTVRRVTGNYNLYFVHGGSATGTATPVTVTDSLADYSLTVLGRTGGGSVGFGFQDRSASGWGQWEITRQAVIPGPHTASEAAAIYEQTAVKRNWYDYTSGGNDGFFGGNETTATSNDPATVPYDPNGFGAASREDLTHADWTATTATVTATTFTPTAQYGGVAVSFTGTSGASYIVSAEISSAGNTSLEWTTGAANPAVTVTSTPTRYSITYTGTGAAENIGLRDPNASGFGAITAMDWQIEQVPSGVTTPSAYSAEATTLIADFDGVDDYVKVAGVDMTLGTGFSLVVVANVTPAVSSSILSQANANYANPVDWQVLTSGESKIYIGDGYGMSWNGANGWEFKTYSTTLNEGSWHVLAFTFDSAKNGSVYQDGAIVGAAQTYAANAIDNNKDLYFCNRESSNPQAGIMAAALAYSRALNAAEVKTATCQLAQKMWNQQGIAVWGAQANCPALDFTTAPLYAGRTDNEIMDRWLGIAHPLWATLFPPPEIWGRQ